jgi:hypothetical protein
MTPPALDHVIKTCLAKDPDRRWQSAGDVGRQLEWIAEGSSEATATEPVVAASTPVWKRALTVGLTVLMTAVISSITVWSLTRQGPQAVTRFAITLPATDQLSSWGIAFSADGRDLVYGANREGVWQLCRRPMDQLEASEERVPLDGTEHPVTDLKGRRGNLGWDLAADGQFVYFTWQENFGDIWVMDVVHE